MSTTAASHSQGLTHAHLPPASKPKTDAQKKRIAELRRQRKEAGRTERERRACDLAQRLYNLAEEFPEHRSDLNKLVNTVRLSGKRTPDRDVEAVKQALRKPLCYSLDDIALETGIHEKELAAVLSAMQATGMVEQRQIDRPGVARGPHRTGWFLTNAPLRSPMVLP